MPPSKRQGERSTAERRPARTGGRRLLIAFAAVTCLLAGSAAWSSAAQTPVDNLPPEVVGNPQVGERLVCAAGSWNGPVSGFTYEWVRDALAIGSGVSHQVTVADRGHSLWCVVTASGSEGSAEAQSANSLRIAGPEPETAPENTIAPEVSGTPAVGETLTCSEGSWQWKSLTRAHISVGA